jgi:hypothetical protein
MSTQTRIVRLHAVADLAAAVILVAAALIAHRKVGDGAYFSSSGGDEGGMTFSIDLGGPLLFLLWALAVTMLVRGLVLLTGWAMLAGERE